MLQEIIETSSVRLLEALRDGKTHDARNLAYTVTTMSEKLGVILATEDQFSNEAEAEMDLSTPEGQQQLADSLRTSPALLSLCGSEVLAVALDLAQQRERREA